MLFRSADSKTDDTDKDAKDSKTSEGKTLADLNLEDGDYTSGCSSVF